MLRGLTTLPDLVLTVLGSSHFVSVFLTVGLTSFGVKSTFGASEVWGGIDTTLSVGKVPSGLVVNFSSCLSGSFSVCLIFSIFLYIHSMMEVFLMCFVFLVTTHPVRDSWILYDCIWWSSLLWLIIVPWVQGPPSSFWTITNEPIGKISGSALLASLLSWLFFIHSCFAARTSRISSSPISGKVGRKPHILLPKSSAGDCKSLLIGVAYIYKRASLGSLLVFKHLLKVRFINFMQFSTCPLLLWW